MNLISNLMNMKDLAEKELKKFEITEENESI